MKVRVTRDPLIRDAFNRLRAYPEGFASPDALKRQMSLADFMRFHLDQEGDDVGNKVLFHCWQTDLHTNGDANPSCWCYDDYHDTGVGRCGCICGWSGDVYDFLAMLYRDSRAEAFAKVKKWCDTHSRRFIRIRLPRSRGAR